MGRRPGKDVMLARQRSSTSSSPGAKGGPDAALDAHPALRGLEVLVGDWSVELAFPPDAPLPVRGRVSFTWIEGGAFLVMRSDVDWSGPSEALAVIGRDDALDTYTVLYVDVLGVSRIYPMRFTDRVWTQWRTSPGFSQRFTGTVSEDGTTITARWETSTDGVQWEHDFDLSYRRTT